MVQILPSSHLKNLILPKPHFFLNDIFPYTHERYSISDTCKLIATKTKSYGLTDAEKKEAGEKAALSYIESLTDKDVPVFFLSNDISAGESLFLRRHSVPVRRLGVASFYNALRSSNIWTEMGFPDVSLEEITDHYKTDPKNKWSHFFTHSSFVDIQPGENVEDQRKLPFREVIRQLRRDLNAAWSEQDQTKVPATPGEALLSDVQSDGQGVALTKSRADLFNAKYAKFKKPPGSSQAGGIG